MNKAPALNHLSPDTSNTSATYHFKKKSGSHHNQQSEPSIEDQDRPQSHYSKNSSHFDYTGLGVFFGNRPGQKQIEPFFPKPHNKKKSIEAPYNNPTNNPVAPSHPLKTTTSKDFSNFDDLFANSTILPAETKSQAHSKKRSNDLPGNKSSGEELAEIFNPGTLEANVLRNHNKKKSREKSLSGLLKSQKEDQETIDNISKLGFEATENEPEKVVSGLLDSSNGKEGKIGKGNVKMMDRIKGKALNSRYAGAGVFEQGKGPGNGGLAGTGSNRMGKGSNQMVLNYQDQEIYEEYGVAQDAFIDQLLEEGVMAGRNRSAGMNSEEEKMPLDKSKEISQDDLKPRLLTEKTVPKAMHTNAVEFTLDSSRGDYKKPNLSLINTDSTVDSENFMLAHDHHNNSFSTPFSVSFTHSGKLDFSSPVRANSGRLHSENSEMNYMGSTYTMQRGLSMRDPRMSLVGSQRGQVDLNQSCISFHGGYNNSSSNNSDHSGNISFNEEFLNGAFTTSYNTPQVRPQVQHQHQHHQHQHQQQRFLPNQNFNMRSNPNMMEQFFIAPQDPNFHAGASFNMGGSVMGQHQQQNLNPGSNSNLDKNNRNALNDGKNPSRMRRKTQQADEGGAYEIDLNRLDTNSRTTLMIRNIPNKYDLPLMMQTIDKNHKNKFDFFYLPIDFSNRCNFGYAFINFTNTAYIKDFYNEFHGKKWEKFNSEKVCEIRYARIQGHSALMQHFQYSRVMNQQDKKLRPYIPPKYELQNKQKIEQLVRQQKLESGKDVRGGDFKRPSK